ncbi:MAG: sensor histidine kinase [Pseudomonadales bacterium]|nr:sensor histidine kinase [Pseudomonadales bacterium]
MSAVGPNGQPSLTSNSNVTIPITLPIARRFGRMAIACKLAHLISLGLMMACGFSAQAQPVVVSSSAESVAITTSVEYYEDSSEALTIEEVLAPSFNVNFIPYDRDLLHFGMTSSAYWVRFGLDWSEMAPDTQKIIEFGPPKLVGGIMRGGIELFVIDDQGQVSDQYSLGSLQSEREIKTLNRGFALVLDESFGDEFYLRVTSSRPLRLPITLWDEIAFQQQSVQSDTMLGLQYGILLAMVFYNLFLFFSIRESSYIYYVLAIATQTFFIFLDSKHSRYLLDNFYRSEWYVDLAERVVYPILVITALLFQRSLLRIWEHNIKLDNVVKLFIAAFGVVILLTLVPNEKVFQYLFILLIVLAIPLAFFTNVDAIRRGNVTAVVHMGAIGVFLIGTIVLMLLQLWPAFPNNQFTVNAYNVGLIAQALLLSLSLSFRYNQIKQEKEDAQLLAINNLVRSEQIKDDLLANVSHELRTPLYGINGLAETALAEFEKKSQNSELITRNLELISASGDRLTKLVNDLLDFSAAREEATYVKFRPVDLNSLVTLVIAICKPLVGEKKIDLRSEVDPDLPLVAGDEDRLQQILVNLTIDH